MAWALIGELTSSMILTLFVVPSMYYIITRLMERVSTWRKSHKNDEEGTVIVDMA